MFNPLCRRTYFLRSKCWYSHTYSVSATLPNDKLQFLEKCPSLFLANKFSSSSETEEEEESFTVSYLKNTCGFSLVSALRTSNYLRLDGPEKPDSIINLLKSYGLSHAQVSRIIQINPVVLTCSLEKNLVPTLQFFHSRGASGLDLEMMFRRNPHILTRRMENHVIPTYNYIRDLVQSDQKAISALKRGAKIFNYDLEASLAQNVNLLLDLGMPKSSVVSAFIKRPQAFVGRPERFKMLVEEAKEMGIDPKSSTFATAVTILNAMKKSTWVSKIDEYERWGCTKEEVIAGFKKFPELMKSSTVKIAKVMDFFVNKLGKEPSGIIRHPVVLTMSLEKRVIPRLLVFHSVLEKGLIKKDLSLASIVGVSEERFLKKYVHCFAEGPQLLKLYEETCNLTTKPVVL